MNHGIIFDFVKKLEDNPKELVILGDGRQEKSFFLVEECLDGMFYFLKYPEKSNLLDQCEIFNLGTNSTTTADEIADIVCQVMGLRDVEFSYTGGRQGWIGDAPVVLYNVSRASRLGWSTKHTSNEAVRIATERILNGE
jgi:UDP-glucose 4-epimerase